MEITGKITNVLDVQEGTSKNGNAWKKQEFVIEYMNGQYPAHASFTLFGEQRVSNVAKHLVAGKDVVVSFDIDSREFNGKWYTTLNAWKVVDAAAAASSAQSSAAAPAPQTAIPAPAQTAITAPVADDSEQLPF